MTYMCTCAGVVRLLTFLQQAIYDLGTSAFVAIAPGFAQALARVLVQLKGTCALNGFSLQYCLKRPGVHQEKDTSVSKDNEQTHSCCICRATKGITYTHTQ